LIALLDSSTINKKGAIETMFLQFRRRLFFLLLFISLSCSFSSSLAQNPWNGKVVLQAFWWDYWNNNYPNGWYNYLSDLAPRLRALGIDAVWIPPTSKGGNGTNDNGYGIFDHYDLGDKYQKGTTKTRLGNKDEYLRMVAIMHANGIDVIQDVVLNHTNGAGSATGEGGIDPAAAGNKYKNFRYVCYETPALNESASNYLARKGRWFKNWQNFNPSPGNGYNTDAEWNNELFGPDNAFYPNCSGLSSNATYNPSQNSTYMRDQARQWMIWLKKQTGVDGFRLDAVKHFPHYVTQDMLWNVKYNAGWANGGSQMFAVGEYVGGASELDTWIHNVQYSNGGSEELCGTFDFSLRSAIYDMVVGNGFFNIGSIPSRQQSRRLRTVPFVNNHDTFRPRLSSTGNYIGWNTGDELAPHIDPFDVRLPAAYAVMMAVDGSPQVFFEDLFDIGGTGKRWTHLPTNTTDLPVRSKIANIIWCHQTLSFKAGAYKVRWQAPDLLVIERSARAIIGVNDNGSSWMNCWIDTDFAPGTVLKDYSGANGSWTYTVPADRRVYVNVPPSNSTHGGYCIIGPVGYDGNTFNPPQRPTTQEWELAQDLGDSHSLSLQQGGALPANSTALRTAGRIFAESGKTITVNLYPSVTTRSHTLNLYNSAGTIVATRSGSGTLTLTHTPSATGFYTIRARHSSSSSAPLERVWVKATYTAPRNVSTSAYPASVVKAGDEPATALSDKPQQTELLSSYPNPFNPTTTVTFRLHEASHVKISVFNTLGQEVAQLVNETLPAGEHQRQFYANGLASGVYFLRLQTPSVVQTQKLILAK
jgi:alpha-amylase